MTYAPVYNFPIFFVQVDPLYLVMFRYDLISV